MLFCFSHHFQVFIIYMVWLNTFMAQSHVIHLPLNMCPCCSWQLPFGRQLREDCMEDEFIAPSSHPRPVCALFVLSLSLSIMLARGNNTQFSVAPLPVHPAPILLLNLCLFLQPVISMHRVISLMFHMLELEEGEGTLNLRFSSEPEVGVEAAQQLRYLAFLK